MRSSISERRSGRPARIGAVVGLGLLAAVPVAAQSGVEGSWRGQWIRNGDSLSVTLEVRRDSAGRLAATFSSERLRVSGIPFAAVDLRGCCDVTMSLRGDRSTTEFTGQLGGDSLAGGFREGSSEGRFWYRRVPASSERIVEREVTFPNGTVTLAGTLLLPRSDRPAAAVVFIHGSGAEGRWASRFLALEAASRGVAALIFDKRGVGASAGDWRTATIEDLAADAAAAVAMLRREPGIDPRRIGIHGHSQGGTLAPLVAARAEGVAFVVGSAAAGVPLDSTEIFSVLNSVLPAARSAADSANARDYVGELVTVAYHRRPRARFDSLAAAFRGQPWFFEPPPPDNGYWAFSPVFGRFRPLDWWSRITVPVLLLYGGNDQRVPPGPSADRIEAALRSAGNRDVTVRIYPGADHTFRLPPGPGGWPVTAPGYLEDLLSWLARR